MFHAIQSHFRLNVQQRMCFILLHFWLNIHPWPSQAHPVSHSSNLFSWRTDIISIHGHGDHTVNGDYTTQPVFQSLKCSWSSPMSGAVTAENQTSTYSASFSFKSYRFVFMFNLSSLQKPSSRPGRGGKRFCLRLMLDDETQVTQQTVQCTVRLLPRHVHTRVPVLLTATLPP